MVQVTSYIKLRMKANTILFHDLILLPLNAINGGLKGMAEWNLMVNGIVFALDAIISGVLLTQLSLPIIGLYDDR